VILPALAYGCQLKLRYGVADLQTEPARHCAIAFCIARSFNAGGVYPPKPLQHILGGLLTFESDWSPGLGDPLIKALAGGPEGGRLDLGCAAAHGLFGCGPDGCGLITPIAKQHSFSS
jgi:hypothetical protein